MFYAKSLCSAVLVLALSACTTQQQVIKPYPKAPTELMQEAPNLDQLQNDASLIDVSTTITNNYSKYHSVKQQLTSLQEWIRRIQEE